MIGYYGMFLMTVVILVESILPAKPIKALILNHIIY